MLKYVTTKERRTIFETRFVFQVQSNKMQVSQYI